MTGSQIAKGLAGIALAFSISLACAGARADEATLPPMPKPLDEMAAGKHAVSPEQASMEAWGRAHPACLEWSDGCQTCVGGEKPGCSTVGVACQRGAPVCRKSAPTPVPAPAPASPAPVKP